MSDQRPLIACKRLARTFSVPAGGGELSFWVDRTTEESWDFVFVEAHPLGGDNWTTLPDLNGHTSDFIDFGCPFWLDDHPFLAHYQTDNGDETCSPTGTTGSWNAASGDSGAFEQWRVDLGAYAGSDVEVSVSYERQHGARRPGLFVDDVSGPGDQGRTSFEDDGDVLDGWTVPGPPPGSAPNENDWIIGTVADGPPTTGESVQASFDRHGEILTFLENAFARRYPFSTSGGIVDDPSGVGFALENQTRPIYAREFFSSPGAGDWVVVHELAHQWYGDSLTVQRWQHIWLNEGFATYVVSVRSLRTDGQVVEVASSEHARAHPGWPTSVNGYHPSCSSGPRTRMSLNRREPPAADQRCIRGQTRRTLRLSGHKGGVSSRRLRGNRPGRRRSLVGGLGKPHYYWDSDRRGLCNGRRLRQQQLRGVLPRHAPRQCSWEPGPAHRATGGPASEPSTKTAAQTRRTRCTFLSTVLAFDCAGRDNPLNPSTADGKDEMMAFATIRRVMWLSALAPGLMLAGCGTKQAAAPDSGAAASDEVNAIREGVNESYVSWAGGVDARQAAEVLITHAENGDYSQCMADKGYEVPWERSINLQDPIVDGLAVTNWLRPPHYRIYSEEVLRYARELPIGAQREESTSGEQNAVAVACREQSPRPSEDEVGAIMNPPGRDDLTTKWDRALVAAAENLGTFEDYEGCLGRFDLPGHPAGSGGDLGDEFSDAMRKAEPDLEAVPVDGQPRLAGVVRVPRQGGHVPSWIAASRMSVRRLDTPAHYTSSE